jgi:multidrug efflux pump subunit AcrB
MIITPYPGASANDVRDLVTKKIEDALQDLDGYDYCKGVSKENVSVVTVYFTSDTDNDTAMQDVRNAVTDVQKNLPDGASASTLNTDVTESTGILISVSGENYSYDKLESFGDKFKKKLRGIEGISKINLIGKLDKEVKVDLNIARLNQLGLSIEDVCKILAAQNVQIPSGNIDYPQGKITVNTPGNYTSVEDIKNTIISVSSDSGVVTRIKDIADVYMDTEDGAQKIKADGHNAVLLAGYFVENKNVVIIGKDVRKAIDEVKATLPPDIKVNEVVYQPDTVSESTNEFMLHLIIGIVLVLGAVFMAMGMRNALVVSTAIPLSILFTFIMMYWQGIPIHKVSLAALIVALGILVDDAIVVSDNIQVRMDGGDDPLIAAYNGATRCTIPNLSATTAIIVAFAPLLAIPGGIGQFLYALPWVVIVSVAASYFVAMFVVPSMMVGFPRGHEKQHKNKESKIRLFFQDLLKIGLQHKKQTVLCAVSALVLVLIFVIPRLTSQFFPYVDKDIFYIQINSEKSGDMDATEQLADEVAKLVKKVPEVTACTESVGDGVPKFYVTMMPSTPSDDYAMVAVKFDLDKSKRFESNVELAGYLQSMLNETVSGGKCKVKLLEYAIPTDAKVIVRLTGDDMNQLVQVSKILEQKISDIPGTSNIRDNWDDDSLQLNIDLDEDKASCLGISKYDVQKQINIALYGYNASVYRKNGNEYNIRVKSDIKDAARLENFAIKSSLTGNKTPLKDFAAITYNTKANTINTYDGDLAVDILADPVPGYDSSKIENQIESEVLPKVDLENTRVTFYGEREDIKENFTAMGVLAVVSIFALYIILLLIFNSFVQPLIILTTIPLSLIGSLLGLYIFNQPLSFTAFLGIIALIGLVAKNGILLVDFINE